jgi:MAF protein
MSAVHRPRLPLFLASTSPRRRRLLEEAGITFELFAVSVDEERLTEVYDGPLGLLGEYLAERKALATRTALLTAGREGLVLAADTTVLLEGRSLPKPRNADEAEQTLARLRGREHIVATGVALVATAWEEAHTATSATRVLMRAYGAEEVAAYVATGDPLDKAGAYSIQHPEFQPVEGITGCHLGVIGLPVCIVAALLGQRPLSPADSDVAADGCVWSRACTPPYPPPEAVHRFPLTRQPR